MTSVIHFFKNCIKSKVKIAGNPSTHLLNTRFLPHQSNKCVGIAKKCAVNNSDSVSGLACHQQNCL